MAIGEGDTFFPLDCKDTIISLNGITSPENVGAIIRNISGFGFKSVLVDAKTCSPFTRRSIRVSMGNIFDLKTSQTKDLLYTLIDLKNNGYTIIGTANINSAISLKEFKAYPKTVLIIGSEGFGIDKEILSICDQVVKIPIESSVGHLNAACASSIFLYELNNQLSI
jgi:tRNA G18 (ribose-2'-O)-methylase SpoU